MFYRREYYIDLKIHLLSKSTFVFKQQNLQNDKNTFQGISTTN